MLGLGIGFRQKGFSLSTIGITSPSVTSPSSIFSTGFDKPFFFFLFGDVLRLDLKLPFRGTLTIHDGGTIT